MLEGGGTLVNGRGERTREVQDLPRGPRAWLSGEAVPDTDRRYVIENFKIR